MVAQHELSQSLEHRHFHGLPTTRPFLVQQCGEDGVRRSNAGNLVCQIQGHKLRINPLGAAYESGYSGDALHQVIECWARFVRSLLAIADQGHIHDLRIDGADVFIGQTETRHCSGADIADEYISLFAHA